MVKGRRKAKPSWPETARNRLCLPASSADIFTGLPEAGRQDVDRCQAFGAAARRAGLLLVMVEEKSLAVH
jgi:hypothetical protein